MAEGAREVSLVDLGTNPQFQMRQKLDPKAIERYAAVLKNGGTLPPICLAEIEGALVLTDGWHRVAAMRRLGIERALAAVTVSTERDALWAAASANLRHGLPLKKRELRNVFRAYVRSRQHLKSTRLKHAPTRREIKSYRDMEAEFNGAVSYNTIRNWMVKDFADVAKAMGDGGETVFFGSDANTPKGDIRDTAAMAAIEHLTAGRDSFNGAADAVERRRVVEYAKQVLRHMERAGNLGPAPETDFDPQF
jgi:hypothetical protein